MKISTEDLCNVFGVVDKVDSQVGMQASQYVRMSVAKGKLHMATCGLVVSEASVAMEGALPEFFADRRVLSAFLNSCRGTTVNLTKEGNQITLQSGKQKVLLTGMNTISGYGSWEPSRKSKAIDITAELKRELAILAQYAPITTVQDHLAAVYMVKGYGVLATDTFTVAACLNTDVASTIPLPVGLSKLAAKLDVKQVYTEASGAGIQLPHGYLYQTLSTRLKEFPLEAIRGIIDASQGAKAIASFKASDLSNTFAHLRQFVFGGNGEDVVVLGQCPVDEEATFTLDLAQGKSHRRVPMVGRPKQEATLTWPLNPAYPWLDYIASLDGDTVVYCTQESGNHGFRAKHKGNTYLLILADKG